MDNISLGRLELLHPAIREDAILAYNEAVLSTPKGVHPFITSTVRTFPEQAILYAQGRTAPGQIVTFSKPGQSYHNYYLALDFVLQINGKLVWKVDKNWLLVVSIFKKHGFEAGLDWKGKKNDPPHFEKRFGIHWKTLLELHNSNKLITGTSYIDLDLVI